MTDEDISADNMDLDRRNFLKAVGAGVSLSAIDFLHEDEAQIGDITYNPKEEIPYVAGWKNEVVDGEIEKEPFYNKVSIEKWDRIESTRDAAIEIEKFLEESSGLSNDDFSIIGRPDQDSPTNRRIDVGINEQSDYTVEQVEELVPDSVMGDADVEARTFDIPVGVEEIRRDEENACYDEPYPQYNDVPAAAPITPDLGMKIDTGNTAGPFVHNQYGIGWITAQHIVEGAQNDIVELLEHSGDFSGNVIGEVVDEEYQDSPRIDIAAIQRTVSDREPHPWIPRIDYSDNEEHPIVGVVSDKELECQKDNPEWPLAVQGQMSCRETGYITYTEYENGELVAIGLDDKHTTDGDSGGPYFHYKDGEAYMCGVHVGPATLSSGRTISYGNTAQTVEEELDGGWLTQ